MSDLDHVPPFNQRGPLPLLFPAAVLRLCLCYGFFNLRDEFFNCVCPQIDLLRYLSSDRDKEDKVFDDPSLMKTPVVRNGKKATVGYCPEVWAGWE